MKAAAASLMTTATRMMTAANWIVTKLQDLQFAPHAVRCSAFLQQCAQDSMARRLRNALLTVNLAHATVRIAHVTVSHACMRQGLQFAPMMNRNDWHKLCNTRLAWVGRTAVLSSMSKVVMKCVTSAGIPHMANCTRRAFLYACSLHIALLLFSFFASILIQSAQSAWLAIWHKGGPCMQL